MAAHGNATMLLGKVGTASSNHTDVSRSAAGLMRDQTGVDASVALALDRLGQPHKRFTACTQGRLWV